jgi:uncharacterized protein (TIGR02466 family)
MSSVNNSPEINGLFPVPVVRYNYIEELNDLEIDCINKELDIDISATNNYNNQNSHGSANNYVLDKPELQNIKEFCTDAIHHFAYAVLDITSKTKFYITQSWLNAATFGGGSKNHTHPNSIFSGVFYIKSSDEDKIMFTNPCPQMSSTFQHADFNPFNSMSWWVPATQGSLLLFPSYLPHGVPEIFSENRVSLAFNTFWHGEAGRTDFREILYLPEVKQYLSKK